MYECSPASEMVTCSKSLNTTDFYKLEKCEVKFLKPYWLDKLKQNALQQRQIISPQAVLAVMTLVHKQKC